MVIFILNLWYILWVYIFKLASSILG